MLFLIVLMLFFANPLHAATTLEPVERVSYDWNGDGIDDVFAFHLPKNWNDPGEYTRLKITLSPKLACEIVVKAGMPLTGAISRSVVPSKYMALFQDVSKQRPILMVRNWVGGHEGDELLLYELHQSGCPTPFEDKKLQDKMRKINGKNLRRKSIKKI